MAQASVNRVSSGSWTLRRATCLTRPLQGAPSCRRTACSVAAANSSSSSSEQPAPAPSADAMHERGHTLSKQTLAVPPRSWTLDQVAQFEAAVYAVGGPFMATAACVLPEMPDNGLDTGQVQYGIGKLRQQMRDASASADEEEALGMLRSGKAWPAGLSELVEGAVLSLGGVDWATPARILQLVPNSRLSGSLLSSYLMRRRTPQQRPHASRSGRGALFAAVDAAGARVAAGKPPVGGGPPHGWSPGQSKHFLAAVLACGGSGEATSRGVCEWLCQHGRPDESLTRKQVDVGLCRLHETLRGAGLSWAAWSTAPHDARPGERAALASLWVQCGANFRWTPELRSRLARAVDTLGGPNAATPKRILPLLAGSELTYSQVQGGLQMLRQRRDASSGPRVGRPASVAPAGTGAEKLSAAPLGQPGRRLQWTADLVERFDAAVSQLGGLELATSQGVAALMTGCGVRADQIHWHLAYARRKARRVGVRGGSRATPLAAPALPEGGTV